MLAHKINNSVERLTFIVLLITPVLPKIYIAANVYISIVEILLLLLSILFLRAKSYFTKFNVQNILVLFWGIILISSTISLINYPDYISFVKIFKGLIYIPIIYLGYKYFRYPKTLVTVLNIGIFSLTTNIIYYFYNNFIFGFSIWNVALLSSGFSNRAIKLPSFEIVQLTGAHAIWGNYCILILAIAIFLQKEKLISKRIYYSAVTLFLVTLLISVSRGFLVSFIIFSIVFIFLVKSITRFSKRGFYKKLIIIYTSIIVVLLFSISSLPAISSVIDIPLVSKILYTIESVQNKGEESNVSLRFNVWNLSLNSFQYHPLNLLVGVGYNRIKYKALLDDTARNLNYYKHYPDVPESLYFTGLMYGGIFGLIFIILYIFNILKITIKYRKIEFFRIFGSVFIAFSIVNAFVGASMIADLLYGQTLMIIGFIYRYHEILKNKYYELNEY